MIAQFGNGKLQVFLDEDYLESIQMDKGCLLGRIFNLQSYLNSKFNLCFGDLEGFEFLKDEVKQPLIANTISRTLEILKRRNYVKLNLENNIFEVYLVREGQTLPEVQEIYDLLRAHFHCYKNK